MTGPSSRAWVFWPRRVLVSAVRVYRLLLSPWLGNQCRFEPTCSVYAIEALERHGAIKGSGLTAARLLRCGPWCAGGHDPVPSGRPDGAGRLFFTPTAPPVSAAPPASSSLRDETCS